MRNGSRGFSTVEAMVALVVFAVGVLGAAGTMALAWRAELSGERAAAISRSAGSLLDSLRSEVLARSGRCSALAGGTMATPHGGSLDWAALPSAAGREMRLTVSFLSLTATSTDSVWSFIPCR